MEQDSQSTQQPRLHGLQFPLHPFQVGAIVIFCTVSFINFSLSLPLIQQRSIFLALFVIEAFLTGASVAIYMWTSLIDTSDPSITCHNSSLPLYCHACRSQVDSSSKHCQACKKCVIGFDHHCLWLNCCIGSPNYNQFLALLALSSLLFSMYFSTALSDLITSYTATDAQSDLLLGPVPLPATRALLAFVVVVTAAALSLTGDLLLFHIILRIKGLTTYEYILAAKDDRAAAESPHGRRDGGTAAWLRQLPLCDSCMAIRATQRQPPAARRAGVSVCRALGTTTEAGKQARERRLNRGRVAPLPDAGDEHVDSRDGERDMGEGAPARAGTLVRVSDEKRAAGSAPQASMHASGQGQHGPEGTGLPVARGAVHMIPVAEALATSGYGGLPRVASDSVWQLGSSDDASVSVEH